MPQAHAYVPPRRVPRRQAPPKALGGHARAVVRVYRAVTSRARHVRLQVWWQPLTPCYEGMAVLQTRPHAPHDVYHSPPHQPCYRLSPLPRPGGLLHACICAPYHLHLLLTQTSSLHHHPQAEAKTQERTRHSDFTATFWVGSNRPADTQAATCYVRVDRAVAGW